jgi:hypothetical protein
MANNFSNNNRVLMVDFKKILLELCENYVRIV